MLRERCNLEEASFIGCTDRNQTLGSGTYPHALIRVPGLWDTIGWVTRYEVKEKEIHVCSADNNLRSGYDMRDAVPRWGQYATQNERNQAVASEIPE